jgi:hypothetical protein
MGCRPPAKKANAAMTLIRLYDLAIDQPEQLNRQNQGCAPQTGDCQHCLSQLPERSL